MGTAVRGAVRRNHRLYGGLVVHLGLLIAVVAIAWSSSFRQQTEVTLSRGDTTRFAGYTLRYDGAEFHRQPFRTVFVADLAILEGGREVHQMIPSLNFYPNSNEPIGTPSISKGTPANQFRDLYASLQTLGMKGASATFRLYLNPGVFWLWVGGGVMVLGGIVALVPGRKTRTVPLPEHRAVPERVGAAP